MSSISLQKRHEIKVGKKLGIIKERIKEIRNNRAVVIPEDTAILEVMEAMTDIFLEAEYAVARVLEVLTIKSQELERQIEATKING
jgi:hypothetical protein